MTAFRLSAAAELDLEEIAAYIAIDDPDAAQRVLDHLEIAMRRLAAFPRIGHGRAEIDGEQLRVWNQFSFLIVYRPEASRSSGCSMDHAT